MALDDRHKKAVIAEVKRNPAHIDLSILKAKAAPLLKELAGYTVRYQALSLEDM